MLITGHWERQTLWADDIVSAYGDLNSIIKLQQTLSLVEFLITSTSVKFIVIDTLIIYNIKF